MTIVELDRCPYEGLFVSRTGNEYTAQCSQDKGHDGDHMWGGMRVADLPVSYRFVIKSKSGWEKEVVGRTLADAVDAGWPDILFTTHGNMRDGWTIKHRGTGRVLGTITIK